MTTMGLNSGKCVWMEETPGRAVCPQTAVHPVLNILYSEGEHDGKAEDNGALGTERPTQKTAVRLEWNILDTESEHDGKAEDNGALGTERPACISKSVKYNVVIRILTKPI